MRNIRLLFLLVLVPAFHTVFAQQWVENKGDWSIKLSHQFRSYSKVYDLDGNLRPVPDLQNSVTALESEYGISNSFSLLLSVPFVHNKIAADTTFNIPDSKSVNKLGDALFSVRYNFIPTNENLRFSLFIEQGLGTAENKADYRLNTGYADLSQFVGGTMHWISGDRFYASLDAGYRFRHKHFGDEVAANAELGFRAKGLLWIYGRSEGVQPMENGNKKVQGGNFGLYAQHAGYWNTGLGVRMNLQKLEISGMVAGNFKGQYSPGSAIFYLSLKYRIKANR